MRARLQTQIELTFFSTGLAVGAFWKGGSIVIENHQGRAGRRDGAAQIHACAELELMAKGMVRSKTHQQPTRRV